MRTLSPSQFDALISGAAVLSSDGGCPCMWLTPDGRVVKIFRKRRALALARNCSARRFKRASRVLEQRGIDAVRVEQIVRVPAMQRDLVVYRFLPGVSLREAIESGSDRSALLLAAARLLAQLHDCGVYFRGAHFGNILVCSTDQENPRLAIVDLSAARFRRGPLSPGLRARNFRPITRYEQDLRAVRDFGFDRFVRAYLDAAHLNPVEASRFRLAFAGLYDEFAAAAVGSLFRGRAPHPA